MMNRWTIGYGCVVAGLLCLAAAHLVLLHGPARDGDVHFHMALADRA